MRPLVLVLAATLGACVSAPRARVASAVDRGDLNDALDAYGQFRRTEGADVQVLAPVAALLLERELRSDDPAVRDAVLTQLALAGTRGTPVLQRIARSEGLTPARLGALAMLAQNGSPEARLVLRSYADSDNPEVLAAAVLGMDPRLDRALLVSHARSNDPEVRRRAVSRLSSIARSTDVRELLTELARVDPEGSVRAAAVRSLGHAGPAAIGILRERLSDPDPGARYAAVGALTSADARRGRVALAPLLAMAPSAAGIEAARLIAQERDPEGATVTAADAREFLRRALSVEDAALRAQAGVAIASLPTESEPPLAALREALAHESDVDARLSFARALFRHDPGAARTALRALLRVEQAMARVQAATLLAAEGDGDARRALEEVVASHESSIVRRTAARALARDAMAPDAVWPLLRDGDALVRVYAAGGILAAAAAG